MTRVLLVRHGQSVWNADGRWQGHADPPLTELGRRQAVDAASAVVGAGLTAVVTSDLQRAQATGAVVAEALGLPEPAVDARWRERDAGAWTGLTRGEIEERWPGALAEGRWPEGWEPHDDVVVRALAALDDLAAGAGPAGVVLVVSHGGVVRALEHHLGGPAGLLPNLGGRWLELGGRTPVLGERVLLVDPAHVQVTTPRQP